MQTESNLNVNAQFKWADNGSSVNQVEISENHVCIVKMSFTIINVQTGFWGDMELEGL